MPDYRRLRVKGGCYFFTVVCAGRRPLLIDNIHLLRSAFRYVLGRHPFVTDAMVVLPDHLHCIWTLPEGDDDFSNRWGLIKAVFSRSLPGSKNETKGRRKGERGIWQRRFWEHLIRDDNNYARHVDYIHYNPVRHNHVGSVADWPYSSFQRFVKRGIYDVGWAGPGDEDMDCE